MRPCQAFIFNEGVSTIPDECKGVGLEIGTSPKRKTTLMSRRYSQCRWQHRIIMCRTANGWDINGFGQLKDGRGNICPVTIILPTLAMEAKEAFINEYDDNIVDAFMELLDQKIHEAKDMLIERFDWICSQSPDAAKFMYENGVMAGYIPEEGIRSALKHGTLAIGQLGLAEALQILIGKDHTEPEGMEVAKHIEQLFKNRCAEFKGTYKLNFGVYYTPKFSWVA